MLRVLHIIDNARMEEVRLALGPLIDSAMTRRRWHSEAVVLGSGSAWLDDVGLRCHREARCGGLAFLVAPSLQRRVSEGRFDVVHCWSVWAAEAVMHAVGGRVPVVVSAWDPLLDKRELRVLRGLAANPGLVVLCHAEQVRRRWTEHGWPLQRSVVVRPGIDFGLLNRLKQMPPPEEIRRGDTERLVLMPGPPTRRGGHELGLWATIAAHYLAPELRLVMPGRSMEADRLQRFAGRQPHAHVLRGTRLELPLETLVAHADLLLVPAPLDISSTPIAWAMAAGTPILAFATYAIAELIASGLNGELVKPHDMRALISKLLDMVRSPQDYRRLPETASGHAFEAFGMTRYVEQVQHAYENMLDSKAVGEGMVDSAADT